MGGGSGSGGERGKEGGGGGGRSDKQVRTRSQPAHLARTAQVRYSGLSSAIALGVLAFAARGG